MRDLVTDLADRLGTSVAAVVVGLSLVALGALIVGWMVWGRSEPPPELSIPYADGLQTGGPSVAEPSASTSSSRPVELLVHVAGAVVHPGVYSLSERSRVGDLISLAGGPLEGADLNPLNLAAPVVDGSRVYVPELGETDMPAVVGPDVDGSGQGGAGSDPVDLNTADATALETLPGIGPATAAAILAHREAHGPFHSVDELLEVRGIGEAKLAALRDLVTA
jgi:competence protein ComEA